MIHRVAVLLPNRAEVMPIKSNVAVSSEETQESRSELGDVVSFARSWKRPEAEAYPAQL